MATLPFLVAPGKRMGRWGAVYVKKDGIPDCRIEN